MTMQPSQKPNPDASSADPFRSERLEFAACDLEIINLVLDQVPELRICAGVVRAARAARLQYPISSAAAVSKLLNSKQRYVEGHWLRPALIDRYMVKELFPISDERELVTRTYVALLRCKEDIAWAARTPSYGTELLAEYADTLAQKGGE
jgi:hypothetical protein